MSETLSPVERTVRTWMNGQAGRLILIGNVGCLVVHKASRLVQTARKGAILVTGGLDIRLEDIKTADIVGG